MYSPKIKEDLVPRLYLLAKRLHVPMTAVVDRLRRESLANYSTSLPESESSPTLITPDRPTTNRDEGEEP